MPAQIYISADQLKAIMEECPGVDITVVELHAGAEALDFWPMEEQYLHGSTHRSIMVGLDGEILQDIIVGDHE